MAIVGPLAAACILPKAGVLQQLEQRLLLLAAEHPGNAGSSNSSSSSSTAFQHALHEACLALFVFGVVGHRPTPAVLRATGGKRRRLCMPVHSFAHLHACMHTHKHAPPPHLHRGLPCSAHGQPLAYGPHTSSVGAGRHWRWPPSHNRGSSSRGCTAGRSPSSGKRACRHACAAAGHGRPNGALQQQWNQQWCPQGQQQPQPEADHPV